MKILLACFLMISLTALCLSLLSLSASLRTEQTVRSLPPPPAGTYLTPTEKEVLSHAADRVEAERAESRALDRSAGMLPPGGGIQATPINPAPFR